jgi:hypothetical protein
MVRNCLTILFALTSLSLAAQDSLKLVHSLFLIGDCGEPYVQDDPMGTTFLKTLSESPTPNTTIYLGDNVYPKGMPAKGHRLRSESEFIMQSQVSFADAPNSKTIFIPGNHDWEHWGRDGLQYIHNQQTWIDSLNNPRVTLLPRDGCPGPVELKLTDRVVLVIIDTQWLIHQWQKPGEESSCDAKAHEDVLTQLDDILYRNRNKRVIVAGHHPLITYGEHGGVYPFKTHIFPFLELSDHLYIPLPVVGSVYPLYRKWFGHIQDTKHPLNRQFVEEIQKVLAAYPGSIYVSGHEHALEHIVKNQTHMIVSGSGAKVEMVKKKAYALYADDVRGFVKADIFEDGSVVLCFIQVDATVPEGKQVYSATVPLEVTKADTLVLQEILQKQFVNVRASTQYKARKGKRKLLGDNYRSEWAQEIQVPVFDIGSMKGGLKILQRGGGQQTLSLRMEDSTSHEYVIRSVEKFPEAAVPEVLRKTFAQDLVQDQISASHPYAAVVIPTLADAVGIYHTNPKVYFVPDDPRLGEYQKLFANTLVIFEERPAGNWVESDHFGNSKKIINTAKVVEKLADDNDNRVDQEFALKSRLFDMIIGDWDRHDDQWRWATFKGAKGDIYRPIPRDRDQAFFVNEGKISKIWSRKWALPKFEGFDEEIDWPSGLSFNARYFDRSFLNELSKEQWQRIADQLKKDLTDEEIDRAIKGWPDEIYRMHGERISKNLKSRRDKIVESAISHYEFLAREVDIAGSNKPELFEIIHQNGSVQLSVFKLNKEGEQGKLIFTRAFSADETKEIRLYGQGGVDKFITRGAGSEKIIVRIIGGEGKDIIDDNTTGRRSFVYDLKDDLDLVQKTNVRDRTSLEPHVNEYNRKAFKYNRLAPLLYGNANYDDGLFFGGGFIYLKHGFRKEPFSQRHLFLASFAPQTLSFNFQYDGKFTNVIGQTDLDVNIDVKSPNYVNNFFGMGNETIFDRDIDDKPGISVENPIQYYRYRFEEITAQTFLTTKLSDWGGIGIGPSVQRIELEEPGADDDRYITEYGSASTTDIFNEYTSFAGIAGKFQIDKRNNKQLTTRGTFLRVDGKRMFGLNKAAGNFWSGTGYLSFYHSFRIPSPLVFAIRVGMGRNIGDYKFYQAQILDGRSEVRGLRKTRFYGDSKLFTNTEVRVKLRSFRTYLFPASVGLLAFYDVGRVWYKDADGNDPSSGSGQSTKWHQGIGGGIWFTPFDLAVISTEVGRGEDGVLGYIRLGFLF